MTDQRRPGEIERSRSLEMTVLNHISRAVMRERDVSALLRQVLEILCREMGLVRGTVTLRRGEELVIEASNGLSDEEMRRGHYRLGEGITGQVALSGQARIVPDITREPEFLYRTGARERDSHVAFICVPVVHQGEVIGTQMKATWESRPRAPVRSRNSGSREMSGMTRGMPESATCPVIPSPSR